MEKRIEIESQTPHIFKRDIYNNKGELHATLLCCVDFSYKLSNKFIEDFERIMDFVEYKHIVLKPYKVGNGIK